MEEAKIMNVRYLYLEIETEGIWRQEPFCIFEGEDSSMAVSSISWAKSIVRPLEIQKPKWDFFLYELNSYKVFNCIFTMIYISNIQFYVRFLCLTS